MARGSPLVRQWNLLKALQAYRFGVGSDELAQRLGCSVRQAKRDLTVLRDVGFPITFEARDFGKRFWKLSSQFIETGRLVLSMTEMLSLFLSRQLLAPLAGTQFGDGLATALGKIKALLPDRALLHFHSLDERLFVKSMPGHDYSGQDEQIRTINQAAADCRVLRVNYHSAHSGRDYEWSFHPYGFVLFGLSLYCVGYVVERGEVRTLKMDRLLGLEATRATFERPADFSLHDHFQASFGVFTPGKPQTVKVKFTGWAAVNVRELQWHRSQRIVEDCPAHVIAQFELADTTEFKRWVLGFGRHATVLQPREFAIEIMAELAAAHAAYAPR
jgi:predicted DNA-binding transcriptional regulator YafY